MTGPAAQTSTPPAFRGPTPSQTIGPFFRFGMEWLATGELVDPATPGAVRLSGRVTDGDGAAVPDAMVELWQTGTGPTEGGAAPGVFGRCLTDVGGRFAFTTTRPGRPDGVAAHFAVSVFARGLLQRLVTVVYLPEDATGADGPLAAVDPSRRATLVASGGPVDYRWDIRLRGDDETVFFSW